MTSLSMMAVKVLTTIIKYNAKANLSVITIVPNFVIKINVLKHITTAVSTVTLLLKGDHTLILTPNKVIYFYATIQVIHQLVTCLDQWYVHFFFFLMNPFNISLCHYETFLLLYRNSVPLVLF